MTEIYNNNLSAMNIDSPGSLSSYHKFLLSHSVGFVFVLYINLSTTES